MNEKFTPPQTPQNLATERLITAIESAIVGIEGHLVNLSTNGQDAKWSVSDLVRLIQLRTQLQGEQPRTVRAYWVDDPHDPRDFGNSINDN